MINWNKITNEDAHKIRAIADKAIAAGYGETLLTEMDLVVCHTNACELDLDKLLESSADDLMHDVAGISENINRKTGRLQKFFEPRCAA